MITAVLSAQGAERLLSGRQRGFSANPPAAVSHEPNAPHTWVARSRAAAILSDMRLVALSCASGRGLCLLLTLLRRLASTASGLPRLSRRARRRQAFSAEAAATTHPRANLSRTSCPTIAPLARMSAPLDARRSRVLHGAQAQLPLGDFLRFATRSVLTWVLYPVNGIWTEPKVPDSISRFRR